MFWVREAIRRGYFLGPRLQLAGRAITHSRGHIHWAGGVADTADEIRREVRVLVAEGADVIKVVASGGGTKAASRTSPRTRRTSFGSPSRPRTPWSARPSPTLARRSRSRTASTPASTPSPTSSSWRPGAIVDMGGAGAPTGLPKLDQRVAEKLAASPAFLDLNPQSSGWDTLVLFQGEDRQWRRV